MHKIKEKQEMRKKGEKKAGNERPVKVNVKLVSFTPNPHLFPPMDQNSDADAAHPCWWGPRGANLSHGEGDEAVVSLDVPFEDL